jgi:hypothetical protein
MSKILEAKDIVRWLLDKYDRSLSSVGQNKVNQTFVFKVDGDSFPSYLRPNKPSDTDHALKVFNALKETDFVSVNQDYDGLYDKVTLKTDSSSIASARRFLGVEDPEDVALNYHKIFADLSSDPDETIANFANKMAELTRDHRHLDSAISYFQNEETLDELIKSIKAIDLLDGEVRERNFSIGNLGDSKRFAVLQPKIDRIIREFSNQDFSDQDKPSRVLGVVSNPTFAMVKNGLVFKLGGQIFDLSLIHSPFSLFDTMISDMEVIGFKARRVITIENETTFFDFNDPDAVVVYLAGFHNRIRRDLLKKIYSFCPSAEYLHWSDIDSGGFYITNHLREDTGIPFKPYRMGIEELVMFKNLVKPLSKNDVIRLKKQLSEEKMSDFYKTINYMLENNCKLEQEAFSAL